MCRSVDVGNVAGRVAVKSHSESDNSNITVRQKTETKIRWADYCEQMSDSEMDFDSIPILSINDIIIIINKPC